MTVSTFLTILAAFTVLTTTITERIKEGFQVANKCYSGNILATIVGSCVGIFGTFCYYVVNGIQFSPSNFIAMILMGPAVALSAMGSYDKVKEAIKQITQLKK